MKRFLVIALLVLMVASISYAQSSYIPVARVNGALAWPVAPDAFKDGYKMGYGGGGGVGIMMPEMGGYELELYGSFDYTYFDKDVEVLEALNVMTVFGNAKMNFMPEGKVSPYIVVGLGYFRLANGDSENAFGVHGSFGLQFPVSEKADILVEGDYTYGATEGDGTQMFLARAGVGFTF